MRCNALETKTDSAGRPRGNGAEMHAVRIEKDGYAYLIGPIRTIECAAEIRDAAIANGLQSVIYGMHSREFASDIIENMSGNRPLISGG